LNSFTEGVLYLDVFTKKVEQYVGNYFDVVEQIKARVEKENRKNALLEKEIQAKKDKANFFAMKGGNLRAVAKRMRDDAAEMEEEKVDVRREDKTIREFTIPAQQNLKGDIITIDSVQVYEKGKFKNKKVSVVMKKNTHLLLSGPNGIGKTTLLESLANGTNPDSHIADGIVVGYYRQDFSTLNFEDTVYQSLSAVMPVLHEETLRATAASFLITGEMV
jgi:ATP-binding cassette subfamily F protein 3